jgi:transcription elongation factor GreA
VPANDGAPALLRSLGLEVDGPARWGQLPRSRRPGVFVVESPRASASAPTDIVAVRRWIEGVPSLLLDGERPTPTALDRRLGEFWVPGQTLLYVGRTDKSLAPRVAALYATPLGRRRPHPGGHWLKTLRDLDRLRLWWAETDAPEEYEDAILTAFAEAIPEDIRTTLGPRLGTDASILPWANLESPSGGRRLTGITGSTIEVEGTAPAPTRIRSSERTTRQGAGTGPSGPRRAVTRAAVPRSVRPRAAQGPTRSASATTHLTAEGLTALESELAQLTTVRRPEVIARVKHARELGDLRENADYEAARNEQAFLEGRIRELEQRLRTAVVIRGSDSGTIALGSTVRYEVQGETDELTIVGSTEAAPGAGRISGASPVGKALLGRRAGDEVVVRTPAAEMRYRILEVR